MTTLITVSLQDIANPQLVGCRRCHSQLKLSAKSAFDLTHWNKHREQCVRRPESVVEELRETHDQPPIQPIMRKVLELTAPTPIADLNGDVDTTPTRDDSPLMQLSDTTQSSPPPSPTPAPTPPTMVADPDPVFGGYLALAAAPVPQARVAAVQELAGMELGDAAQADLVPRARLG
ncbi:hypothetical protein FOMPIDRAFT_92530 [Fomitopsis schrenkii]|uniref:Uncharacterized protein n=1 Tax=Fomitopsis schrenkii TaxID=2126942 RepID=S8FF21_FOMSC|nr:hypothetical protein FOMPIDRAFT_92530 [Fomitopsis schrenkii]